MASYEYSLAFRPTEKHSNADALSRLPLPDLLKSVPTPQEVVLLVEGLQDSPISTGQIWGWTRRDPLLAKVLQLTLEGWPEGGVTEELRPF